MNEQAKLALVAIAMSSGASLDDAWSIVDAMPEMPEREASRQVVDRVVATAWGNLS